MYLNPFNLIKINAVIMLFVMQTAHIYAQQNDGASAEEEGFDTSEAGESQPNTVSVIEAEAFYKGLEIEPTVFFGPLERISIKDVGSVVAKKIDDPQRPHPIFEIFFNKGCQNIYSEESASMCFNTWMNFVFSGSSLILQNVEILSALDQINSLKKLQQRLKLTQRAIDELQWLEEGGKGAYLAVRLEYDPLRHQIVISYFSLHLGAFQSPRLIVEVLLDAGNKPSKAFVRDLSLQNKNLMETLFALFEMNN